jgi:hypothetical protein
MRKGLLFILVLGAVTAGSAPAAQKRDATLRVVDRAPLVVRGQSFRDGERVRVVLYAGGKASQVVRASQSGGFVVRFDRSMSRCGSFSLQAFGSKGSRARFMSTRKAPACLAND